MKKTQATGIILFILAILQVGMTRAQSRHYQWRNPGDSLLMVQRELSRWHPYAGLHLSSDAEMYYLGPSFQAGVDVNLAKKLALSAYLHYFYVGVNDSDNGLDQKGRTRTFTGALLIQYDLGKGWYKGTFVGFGLALQRYADRFQGSWGTWDDKRSTATPAIRIGYLFPAGLHAIAIEFNGTGPYTYNEGLSTITEIFTQVSFGGRFIF